MKRLSEIHLDECMDKSILKKYTFKKHKGEDFAESLYRYLTENEIVKSERYSKYADTENVKKTFLASIRERELEKEQIQFFETSFNPKPRKKSITNGQVYPDMGEFLGLLHLSLIAQEINKVYPYGFQFVIGYEGNFFRRAGQFKRKTTEEIYQNLILFKETIEMWLDKKDLIIIFELEEVIKTYEREFYINIENEKFNVMSELPEEYLTRHTQYYLDEVYDENWFETEELAWDYCSYHALRGIAFNRARFTGGIHGLGIKNDYPRAIVFSLKAAEERKQEIHLDLMPQVDTYPYNRLTVKKKNGKWELMKWEDIKEEKYQPVYVEELPYVFYYQEK